MSATRRSSPPTPSSTSSAVAACAGCARSRSRCCCFAAVVYVADPRPGRLPRLRQRRRRGVDGRRHRRLVRGHRAVQAPARPADPAHRADPARARTSSAAASRSSSARTSCRRRSSASGSAPPGSASGSASWLTERGATPGGSSTRPPRCCTSGCPGCATRTWSPWSRRRCCRASWPSRSARSPAACSRRSSRDNAHHGLVDLALEEAHRWLAHNEETFAEIVGERAPWWAPAAVNERVTHRLHLEVVALGRRHPPRPAPPRPHRAGQPARAARPRPAARPGHPGADGAAQGPGARPPAAAGHRDVAVERVPPGAARRRSRTPTARCARRAIAELRRVRRPAARRRGAARQGWTATPPTSRSSRSARYGDELTAVITHTIERWDGKEAARKIELHVGRDLQFIRINGTIVGGLVGVLIHAVTVLGDDAPGGA